MGALVVLCGSKELEEGDEEPETQETQLMDSILLPSPTAQAKPANSSEPGAPSVAAAVPAPAPTAALTQSHARKISMTPLLLSDTDCLATCGPRARAPTRACPRPHERLRGARHLWRAQGQGQGQGRVHGGAPRRELGPEPAVVLPGLSNPRLPHALLARTLLPRALLLLRAQWARLERRPCPTEAGTSLCPTRCSRRSA